MRKTTHPAAAQDKPCKCLRPYNCHEQCEVVYLFLHSIPALHTHGPVSDGTLEALEEAVNQQNPSVKKPDIFSSVYEDISAPGNAISSVLTASNFQIQAFGSQDRTTILLI